MLIIRREQMRALGAVALNRFVSRTIERLAQSHPERTGLDELVREGIGRAAQWKVESEPAVGRFIDLLVTLGTDFPDGEQYEWARDILSDRGLEDTVRLELIGEELRTATE